MLIGLTQQYDKMKAIRQSIITDTTKESLEELETQRDSLKASIAQLALERRKFTKEEIVDWISRYKDGNINDPDYRREIIDTFVNSVYVYDDRLLLTYNYKDGSQTLTLKEIEAALSSDLTSMCPPYRKIRTYSQSGTGSDFLFSSKILHTEFMPPGFALRTTGGFVHSTKHSTFCTIFMTLIIPLFCG